MLIKKKLSFATGFIFLNAVAADGGLSLTQKADDLFPLPAKQVSKPRWRSIYFSSI